MPAILDKVVELTREVVNSTVSSIVEMSSSSSMLKAPPHIVCKEDSDNCKLGNGAVLGVLIAWGACIVYGALTSYCLRNEPRSEKIKHILYYIFIPLTLSYEIFKCLASKGCGECCEATANKVGEIGGGLIELGGAALRSEYERMPKTNYDSRQAFKEQTRRDDDSRQFARDLASRR